MKTYILVKSSKINYFKVSYIINSPSHIDDIYSDFNDFKIIFEDIFFKEIFQSREFNETVDINN
tara:strand:+ start:74 stop:265 length:192 start_codon:yes stop_codon:yes gene_type:complete